MPGARENVSVVRDTVSTLSAFPTPAHLALAPVAFAVTEGPTHVLRYANAAYRLLELSGDITISGRGSQQGSLATELAPLLDRAFQAAQTVREDLYAPGQSASPRWSCTVWPVSSESSSPEGLVIEVRDAAHRDTEAARQRAITERLLLGAMREQENALREQKTARDALEASRRDAFLAAASHDLAASLDEDATRDLVARRVLPRKGTWCIVDIVESNGAIRRLAVVHPDPAKQALARTLAERWDPSPTDAIGASRILQTGATKPVVITNDSGAALIAAAHGAENLATLRTLGFGSLLVIPLVIRGTLLGAITFVTPEGDVPFTPEEIALASDLTERCAMALDNARLYRESDSLRAAADLANKAKSTFLGNMSHELMTPLNAIGGYAELLDMGLRGPVTPEQHADLGRITQNQRHLLSLITEMLNFVRSENGRLAYRFTEVPVAPALTEVAEMLTGAAKNRGLSIECPHGDDDVVVWADVERVRQILMNLVMNAVKYTPANGGNITLTSTVLPETVIIQVADHGHGIPVSKRDAIFEPFVQLLDGLANRQGGVGLGLAISRELARAMHGDLTVESTPGVGSQFMLTLRRTPKETT
jgi:signal transduction histidine kinase